MAGSDPLERLSRWLADQREQITRQVTVRESERAQGTRTEVAIDHLLSCDLPGHGGWRVSTKPTFLFPQHFESEPRFRLKTAAAHGRGRALYCHDRSAAEVVAGVSYHIDDRSSIPVLITMIAFRADIAGNAFMRYRTLAGALVAKHYVHAIAHEVGRGGYVDIDLSDRAHETLAHELGFRPAPRVRGLRPGGLHLRQLAPGDRS